jgi:hypothetical protein
MDELCMCIDLLLSSFMCDAQVFLFSARVARS